MRVIVCGAGQVGSTIARHLGAEGVDVTVIDISEEQVRKVDESYDVRGVVGHASYPRILEKAGAQDADILIAVTRSDEVNMVACQVAYSLFNVKRRIARLRHAGYIAQGEKGLYAAEHLPIDIIISPEIQIAEGIAHRLRTPGAFDMVPMADGLVELLGVHADVEECSLIGQSFVNISQRGPVEGMSVVAVVRNGRCFVPDMRDQLQLGDDVYVIAPSEKAEQVTGAFGHREKIAKHVVIVGCGNIGLHLAKKLHRESPSLDLKIIEHGRERAEYVARELGSGAIVLQGDALDRETLEEAHVSAAETVIAVTNDDETNIFVSVLAKQAGCERAITLINKRSYESLIPMLGIDAVVSPSAMTISSVLSHVRHGAISALYTLREDIGEVVEAEIRENSKLLGDQLTNIALPAGMKIGAVIRDRKVMIADSETELRPGDSVIAVIAYSHLRLAEALLGATRRPFA